MNKKIGIDVDDCICNTLEMDYAYAYFMFKDKIKNIDEIEVKHYNVTKLLNIKNPDDFFMQEKKYIMKHNSMYPKVFVKEVLEKLREKNFEIFIISSRESKFWSGDAEKYLRIWLDKYEISYDNVFCDVANKAEICEKYGIDILIEDNPTYAQNANNKGLETILLRSDYNKHYQNPLNKFAQSWIELYRILGEKYNFNYNDII